MVVRSITERERVSEALQEVGEVNSIYEGRDSTNPSGEKEPHSVHACSGERNILFLRKEVRRLKTLELLQDGLYQAVKENTKRKFYSLHDKICRLDTLQDAWKRVSENNGSASQENHWFSLTRGHPSRSDIY